jgi:hypothetical protein
MTSLTNTTGSHQRSLCPELSKPCALGFKRGALSRVCPPHWLLPTPTCSGPCTLYLQHPQVLTLAQDLNLPPSVPKASLIIVILIASSYIPSILRVTILRLDYFFESQNKNYLYQRGFALKTA